MSVNTPAIEVYVAGWALGNDQTEKGWLYGVKSSRHKALQFHVLLQSGASYWNLPINALSTREVSESISLSDSQLWSCLSDSASVREFVFLRRMACSVRLRSGEIHKGMYRFTVDPDGYGTLADTPNEFKCYHVVELDSGHLVAYPNNRIVFHDSSLTKGTAATKGYKIQTEDWLVDESGFNVSSSDDFMYRSKDDKSE